MTITKAQATRAVRIVMGKEAIRLVLALRHRIGSRHSCKCDECKALKRVCALARERIDQL